MEIKEDRGSRIALAVIAFAGLGLVYLFQHADFLFFLTSTNFDERFHFVFNRTVRILVNDSCMLLLIYALFRDRPVLRLAFYVQLIDLFILFPIYLVLKLPEEGPSELSSPFLSQFHRLIVNPTLMVLLIGGIYYQKLGINRAR